MDCRPDGLELSTGQPARPSSQQQQFQTNEDGLVQPLLSPLSAVEMLCHSALYNVQLTLTLTLIVKQCVSFQPPGMIAAVFRHSLGSAIIS